MASGYDLVILGSGTTAFAGALRAVEQGARVLMVEQSRLGGTCINWGCVPSKTLIHKAQVLQAARRGPELGLNLQVGPSVCPALMEVKRHAVDHLRENFYQELVERQQNIDILQGHGVFVAPGTLQVGAALIGCERFLVATGGAPRVLRLPGLDQVDFLTSYSALRLPCFPASLLVLGGGVIALEMGQMFARFGTRVTIVERGERLLKEFDPRLTDRYREQLVREGVDVHLGIETREVQREGDATILVGVSAQGEVSLQAERLMLAVGTAPATRGIGLEEIGVALDAGGFIAVDEEMRTTVPGICAAGDVTGPPLIAPAGAREAEVAVDNLLNPLLHRRIDHRHTPMAVFTDPEFATVGIDAERARVEGKEVVETWLDLERVAKAHVIGQARGGILLVAEKGSGRLLGAQLLCARAADIIHEATLAVRCGLTVFDLAEMVHVYPTISDGLRQAATDNVRQQRQVF